jgi:uncharacterized protein (TIGR03382 family)
VIVVAAGDDIGVSNVELKIDNNSVGTDMEAPYQFDWDATAAGAGMHMLEASATDGDGNVSTVQAMVMVPGPGGSGGGGGDDDGSGGTSGGCSSGRDVGFALGLFGLAHVMIRRRRYI